MLVLLLHHIVGDGWSLTPLTEDLKQAYISRCQGEAPNWTALPVQYTDYALWQEEMLDIKQDTNSLADEQLAYWQKTLADLPEQLELPTDYPRPLESSYQGRHTILQFGRNCISSCWISLPKTESAYL